MTKKGTIKNSIEGQVSYNKFGSKMIVKEDRGYHDIDIYFPEYNWTFKHNTRQNFKKGEVKCPYEPRICGIGYLGEGKYKAWENNKKTKCYKTWQGMIKRCYDKKSLKRNPTYKDCSVCEEWYNFQNFAKWYEENFYFIKGQEMNLDKDILVKGNKVYSPDTCVFVPKIINTLFIKCDKSRGEYPIGVSYTKDRNKLMAYSNNGRGKRICLGFFNLNEVNEAFRCYKIYKEKVIKEMADEYKNLIPNKLYEALHKYEVEIDD